MVIEDALDTIEGWYIRYARQTFRLNTREMIQMVLESPAKDVRLFKWTRREGGSTALLALSAFYVMHKGVNVMMVYPRYHMAMFGWQGAKSIFSDWNVITPGLTLRPPHGQGRLSFTGVDQVERLSKGINWWAGFFDEVRTFDENDLYHFQQTVWYV